MIYEFKGVVAADKAANTKANGLWGQMVHYVRQEPAKSFDHGQLKDYLKEKEKEAREQDKKWNPSNAYRSNKSLILRATRLSVGLMNGETPRGKSEVQDECNELENSTKTPWEQFAAAMNQATKKFDKLEPGQIPAAAAMIGTLAQTARAKLTGKVTEAKAA